MNAHDIATKAASLVSGDRERVHGNKATNFDNIARLWNAWLSMRGHTVLTGADVAKLMALLKIARMESGEFNFDDATDCCGYAAIAGELSAPTEAGATCRQHGSDEVLKFDCCFCQMAMEGEIPLTKGVG